jgi:hypothetical protein
MYGESIIWWILIRTHPASTSGRNSVLKASCVADKKSRLATFVIAKHNFALPARGGFGETSIWVERYKSRPEGHSYDGGNARSA